MTDCHINEAIAKALGWKPDNRGLGWLSPNGCYTEPPDYCADLNSMHEAEKVLNSDDIFETYYLALYETTQSTRWPVCATARQRAEAFLRTLNKWEEAV